MSGEHLSLDYLALMPPEGPWVVVVGPPGDLSHVGPFYDSEEVIRWYAMCGAGQPINVISLIDPDDYPGCQDGTMPLPDPQPDLPFGSV